MSDNMSKNISLVHSYPRGARVMALAVLDGKLYVGRHKTPQLDVYSTREPFDCLQPFQVQGLSWPRSMAACGVRRCLYMTDWVEWSKGAVVRVTPEGAHGVFAQLAGEPMGVSVSPILQQVVVTLIEDGEYRLRVYTSEGAEISCVKLTMKRPWCAVQLTTEDFLVSHGWPFNLDHRVLQLDCKGGIVRQKNVYGSWRGSGSNQLNRPLELCVTRDGHVVVIDFGNHRVHLLAPDLRFVQHLLTAGDHGIEYPRRLCLDPDSGTLIVGQDNGDVKVFKWARAL